MKEEEERGKRKEERGKRKKERGKKKEERRRKKEERRKKQDGGRKKKREEKKEAVKERTKRRDPIVAIILKNFRPRLRRLVRAQDPSIFLRRSCKSCRKCFFIPRDVEQFHNLFVGADDQCQQCQGMTNVMARPWPATLTGQLRES